MDYASADLVDTVRERYPNGIDALIDLVNRGEAFASVAELVRDGGRISTTLGAADIDALAARGIRATNIAGDPTHDKLTMLAEAVEAGTLTVPIQQTFALDDADAAIAAFTAGTRGKIVLLT